MLPNSTKTLCHAFLLLLVFSFAGCAPDKQDQSASPAAKENQNTSPENPPNPAPTPPPARFLNIIGNGIWVRDAPSVNSGSVLFKLNEGDRCQILSIAGHDLIRGYLDVWYQINFEGKKGFVFGSQTDLRVAETPIVSPTEKGCWEELQERFSAMYPREKMKGNWSEDGFPPPRGYMEGDSCDSYIDNFDPAYCVELDASDSGLMLTFAYPDGIDGQVLQLLREYPSAGGFSTESIILTESQEGFTPLGPIQGFPDTIIHVPPSNLLTVTLSRSRGMYLGEGQAFNVYLLDGYSGRIKESREGLGEMHQMEYRDVVKREDFVFSSQSISIEYQEVNGALEFTILTEGLIQKEDGTEAEVALGIETYVCDKKSGKVKLKTKEVPWD